MKFPNIYILDVFTEKPSSKALSKYPCVSISPQCMVYIEVFELEYV